MNIWKRICGADIHSELFIWHIVQQIYLCVRIFVASFVFLELDLLFVKSNLHKVSALGYAGMVRWGD